MSSGDEPNPDSQRSTYQAPHSARHPIPTIQKYRAERHELGNQQQDAEEAQRDETDQPTYKRAYHAAKSVVKGEETPKSTHNPYRTQNRNVQIAEESRDGAEQEARQNGAAEGREKQEPQGERNQKIDQPGQSATEAVAGHHDPRQKRKDMKHKKRSDGGREVTDPVTHLPIVIRDSTHKDLKSAEENIPAPETDFRTRTGLGGANKSRQEHDKERNELQNSLDGMQKLFPPPRFEDVRDELAKTYERATMVGFMSILAVILLGQIVGQAFDLSFYKKDATWLSRLSTIAAMVIPAAFAAVVIVLVKGWLGRKVQKVWDDEVWDAARQEELQKTQAKDIIPESVAWLNNLLSAVWPLINPDLFTSISDMLEDVMQASLPKVVRMVSVDDLGQGSEAFRILGINWLPTGAASQSVGADGKLKKAGKEEQSDRTASGEGEVESDADDESETNSGDNSQDKQQKEQEQQAIREGMEAEQGDFVNMELAFAYRARSSGKSLTAKAKNAHLYLKFYLPGGIAVPIWVELRGIIGTMRVRLQLTPDPPFFSLCTLTFMGQPQADLSCVPLSKHALNLMDLPLISSFVQSSIDAALAEYVAPKSLTLDLKDMLVGDDFKKDTVARGVVMIFIKSAKDFKEGEVGVGPFKSASDAYVTVSWGKFGKPVASTRIIFNDQKPNWSEWSHILVTREELNADEKLRLQLWDSDKWTADDDLGRVEVDLRELMHSSKTQNKMCDREDQFVGEDPDEEMPGTLQWQVGYFAKTQITGQQLANQTADPDVRTMDDLRKQVNESAERKLREATAHDESKEAKQQEQEDYKEREDALIISTPPDDYPSGIFGIEIHNITGLEVQPLQKRDKNTANDDREDEAEHSEDLPTSYATIILNHQKIYRTRTKPKNAKPFYNTGTERFVANWKTAEVMVAVRDDREKEDDALLGMIYLPLQRVFKEKSQVTQTYPLVGGMGYGKARISMVWRSIDLKLPKELLGWNYGTLEIKCPVRSKGAKANSDEEKSLGQHRIKLRTNMMRTKMFPTDSGDDVEWKPKGDKQSVFLAVRKRYASALIIESRKTRLGPDSTPAFGVFWLKDIPDEEEKTISVKVWKGGKEATHRATTSYGYSGLEENEQPLGEIELTIKIWRGLSGYHKSFAKKARNSDMRQVMETLDTANDEGQVDDYEGEYRGEGDFDEDEYSDSTGDETGSSSKPDKSRRKLRTHTNDDSDASDSDSGTGSSKNPLSVPAHMVSKPIAAVGKVASKVLDVNGHNDPNDGDRGFRAQVRDYKDHHKQLHRKHRGIMQWRGARTVDWMVKKVKGVEGGVERLAERHKDGNKSGEGVETEV